MPFFEECGVNTTNEFLHQINVASFSIPDNPGNVFLYVEGRMLAHKLQWEKTGPNQITCLPIKPGDQWHLKVFQDQQAPGPQAVQVNKHQARQIFREQPLPDVTADFGASALSDPEVQKIFKENRPPGGYVTDPKSKNQWGV
jgi:hypothetical protein